MSQPLLSILIPTVAGREAELSALLGMIKKQYGQSFVEITLNDDRYEWRYLRSRDQKIVITVAKDDKTVPLGKKRQDLYGSALGDFSWQIDDDDDIADDAIAKILDAIQEAEPDCITFREKCLINGQYYKSIFSLIYDDWEGDGNSELPDGAHYHRTPFYKCVIKTEIAKKVPFEHIRYGEDHAWSRGLKPHLRSEVHIPEELYHYIHNSKPEDFSSRYGFIQ